jgi:hypothetical protein
MRQKSILYPYVLIAFLIASFRFINGEEIKEDKWHYIKSRAVAHYLLGGKTNKVGEILTVGNKDPNQVWKFHKAKDGSYYIENFISSLNLDVLDGNTNTNGWPVCQAKPDPKQSWRLIPDEFGSFYIQSEVSNLYLDVKNADPADHAPVCQAYKNQMWEIEEAPDPVKPN